MHYEQECQQIKKNNIHRLFCYLWLWKQHYSVCSCTVGTLWYDGCTSLACWWSYSGIQTSPTGTSHHLHLHLLLHRAPRRTSHLVCGREQNENFQFCPLRFFFPCHLSIDAALVMIVAIDESVTGADTQVVDPLALVSSFFSGCIYPAYVSTLSVLAFTVLFELTLWQLGRASMYTVGPTSVLTGQLS